jgi:hypothetical protein
VRAFAAHGTTMALFLSAARTKQLQDELLAAGHLRRGHPVRGRLRRDLAGRAGRRVPARRAGRDGQGAQALQAHDRAGRPALAAGGTRSHLYHPGHFHEHRKVEDQDMRADLRARDAALRAARQSASPGVPAPGRAWTGPELREPDLPRTAKVRTGPLRTGWTTGTCSGRGGPGGPTALATQAPQDGRRRRPARRPGRALPRRALRGHPERAEAVVVKDAGDDPDVTHGAHLTATVRWAAEPACTSRAASASAS